MNTSLVIAKKEVIMSNFKYIKKIAESYPYEHYERPPICKVELWDFSRVNECEEARIEAVTTVASISYGNEYARNPEKLYELLIERGHESPFEFVWGIVDFSSKLTNLRREDFKYTEESTAVRNYKLDIATFKLKVPIFVARQIMRHRTFSYMEMSRRHTKHEKQPVICWRPPKFVDNPQWSPCPNLWVYDHLKPEQARAYQPLAIYTIFWMQGNYKAWSNFFIYRLASETQEETRLIAQAMWNLLKRHQPEIIETIGEYLDEWIEDCNPIFIPARRKRAEWFRENFLIEERACNSKK